MAEKLYIGNLPYETTERDVRVLFKPYNPVHSVILIADKDTNHSRGYGFVELEEPNAKAAIYDLDDKIFCGRHLRVGKATGKNPRDPLERAAARATPRPPEEGPASPLNRGLCGGIPATRA